MQNKEILIIGGGLAGSEAAWQLLKRNIPVTLYEMRPKRMTEAHQTDNLAELVCSNSMRSDDPTSSAVGLLHQELRMLDSLIMRMADKNRLPAGSALAVERENFSNDITNFLLAQENFTLKKQEITDLSEFISTDTPLIIATGPLTSADLMREIETLTGQEKLAFFDAIAPILYSESLNLDIIWRQSRYDKGSDYLNCPMNKAQYDVFYEALCEADTVDFKHWEGTPYFEGCLPIEVMAMRGKDTLRFGPMKPVGLDNPHSDEKPYAVVQLRQDNQFGTLHNMVGFQTKMTYQAQKQVFRLIPGLENAEFARLGGIHRNSFLNSPTLLDNQMRLQSQPNIRFAGQITGVEGYVESTAIGLLAGLYCVAESCQETMLAPPVSSAIGALIGYISGETQTDKNNFQPMNANYGLVPPPEWDERLADELKQIAETRNLKSIPRKLKKSERREFLAKRGAQDFTEWLQKLPF